MQNFRNQFIAHFRNIYLVQRKRANSYWLDENRERVVFGCPGSKYSHELYDFVHTQEHQGYTDKDVKKNLPEHLRVFVPGKPEPLKTISLEERVRIMDQHLRASDYRPKIKAMKDANRTQDPGPYSGTQIVMAREDQQKLEEFIEKYREGYLMLKDKEEDYQFGTFEDTHLAPWMKVVFSVKMLRFMENNRWLLRGTCLPYHDPLPAQYKNFVF